MNNDQTTEQTTEQTKIEFLYKALEDTQNTIRFLDTKAASVLVLVGIILAYIGAINEKIIDFNKRLFKITEHSHFSSTIHSGLIFLFFCGIVFMLLSVTLSLKAIVPRYFESEDTILSDRQKNIFFIAGIKPRSTFYNLFADSTKLVHNEKAKDFSIRFNNLNIDDIKSILLTELRSVSLIRENKARRVNLSLKFIFYSLLIMIFYTLISTSFFIFN
ncbi:hypothetical protein ABEV77_10380 [Bacillus subtilis]